MKHVTICLYIVGALLVWYSETIGVSLATVKTGPTSYQWNHDQAARMAEVCRWLGAMIFAAGLAERLVHAKTKPTVP